MADPKDDLAAVRTIAEALTGFDPKEQERILRWVREKVGLTAATERSLPTGSPAIVSMAGHGAPASPATDLKSFFLDKKPKNDVQFAATVAYYYRFVAPTEHRKDEITANDLQEACRLVGRERFSVPGQTLRNAHNLGLLNKGSEAGAYAINSVGENLVDVALPADNAGIPRAKIKRKKKKARRITRG